MKRLAPIALALIAVLLWASPAGAHEEIDPAIFPTGKPTFFTLNAANEKTVDLNKVTLTAPTNLPFGETTHEPAGWTVAKDEKVLTWTGGSVKPEQFESWGFEIEGADQPGPLTYKVTLGFTDGSSDDVNVVVNAVTPAATPATTTPTSAGTASTTPTTAGTATTTSKASGTSTSRSRANLALALGAAALVVAIAAIAVSLTRRRNSPPPTTGASTAAGAPPTTDTQDW